MSIGKIIETLETANREYKRMIDGRSLHLCDESVYGELRDCIDLYNEIIALLREYQTLQSSDTSARLAAIKDIPTQRLVELAVAEAAGLISILPSAAERAHQDGQLNEPHGDGWVSVEERLPEENLEVLIVAKGWDKTPPYYLGCLHHMKPVTSWLTGITSAESDWLIHGWSYLRSPEVTHWRPLPEPPKEE